MSSFISGPIVQFSFDRESLVAGAKLALDEVSREIRKQTAQNGKIITQAIADPLQQQAAKLRALYSTGTIGIKDLQVEQKKFLAQLDTEIARLIKKNDLTKQELTALKQVTLERERQANALQRGIGVGVTSGTQSALGLASGNIGVLLSKGLGQLGARLAGIAGGSGAGEFSAAATGIAAITANGGVAIGVLGGVATALVGAAVAAAALAKSGGDLAEKFSNVSQRTGISIRDLQVLDAVAKVAQLDLNDIVIGFRKFSQAITGGAGGEAGGFEGAGKKSTEILKILGVTSKDSFTAIEQVATAFEKLPDGPLKAATAVELFGRSGLQLIPILNSGKDGVEKFRVLIEKYGPTIDKKAVQAQNDWELATLKLSLEVDRLKLSLIPVLGFMTDMANKIADIKNVGKDPKAFAGLLEILTHIVTLPLGGTANIRFVAQFFKEDSPKVETAAVAWKRLGLGIDDAISAVAQAGPILKALEDQANGSAEARKKAAEEAKKEAQAVLDERFKSAAASLQSISQGAQVGGLSGADKALEEERLKLEKIAEIILEFPNLAGQAATAAEQVVAATRGELEKLADESLKKINDEQDRAFAEEVKKQQDLAKLIKETDDQLAIDRAASTLNGVAKILAEEKKRVDETIAKAKELGATEQDLQNLRVTLNQDAQAKIAQLRAEQVKKTRDEVKAEAGRLFDALISGTKNFTQALKQTLLAVILTPVKLVFEAVVAAIFAPLVQRVKDALVALGKSLQGKGGILGKIGDILVPKDSETKLNTQVTGDNTTATSANTDALNGLTQALQTTGAGGSGAGAGNSLFSALGFTPPGGFPGGTGSGNTGGIQGTAGGPLGALFRGVTAGAAEVLLGLGNALGGKNLGVKVGGGITATGGAISGIGSALNNKTLGKVGGVIGGGGLVISGFADGGIKGAGEAALGGGQIGAVLGGPVGAAIGAAAGFAFGLLGGLFGHHGPSQKDIANAIKKQTIANPDQFLGVSFERSAQGKFGDTLNSGFLESPGGIFSSFGINGKSRPPSTVVNFNIHAIDSKNVAQFLNEHGPAIAQQVAEQAGSVRSGIGKAVRQAVHPA